MAVLTSGIRARCGDGLGKADYRTRPATVHNNCVRRQQQQQCDPGSNLADSPPRQDLSLSRQQSSQLV